jgi:hypothetical protein
MQIGNACRFEDGLADSFKIGLSRRPLANRTCRIDLLAELHRPLPADRLAACDSTTRKIGFRASGQVV